MSSILKALKKLEAEKTLRQEAAPTDISRDILRQQPEKSKLVLWLGATCLVATAVSVALFVLLIRKPAEKTAAMILQPPVAGSNVAVQTRQSVTVPEVIPAQRWKISHPSQRTLSPDKSTQADQHQDKTGPVKVTTIPDPTKTGPPAAELPRRTVPVRPQSSQPSETSEQPITLSGIAWNKDSADRLAIVNGQTLTTGSAVGSAVVEEILPDRVRFSQGGRSYEVHLGKSGKTH